MKKELKAKLMQYLEFSMIGIFSFGIVMAVTLLFAEYFLVDYYLSYAIGLFFAYLYNFYFNMKLTFTAAGHMLVRLERFAVVGILISLLCWSGVVFFVEILKSHYLFAIVFVHLGFALLHFRLDKVWVFAEIPESLDHKTP